MEKKLITNKVVLYNTIAFILMTIYAIIRYNFAQDIPFDRFFFFIINKSISYTAIFSIAMSIVIQRNSHDYDNTNNYKRKFGLVGFYLAIIHILISARNLNENTYPKLFENGSITLFGNIAVILGIVGISLLFSLFLFSQEEIKNKLSKEIISKIYKLTYVILLVILFHNFFIGSLNWFQINNWAWFMPPITLVTAVTILLALLIRFYKSKK